MTSLESRWSEVRRKARSSDEFDRVASLAAAVGFLEFALTASGVAKKARQGFMARIRDSGISGIKGWPSIADFKSAVDARNRAVHENQVPDPQRCSSCFGTFHKAWRTLRRRFVTKKTAADLAYGFVNSQSFSAALLFGSLARSKRDPKDMDLLLLDHGEISAWASHYGVFSTQASEIALDSADLLTETNRAAIECGWLDIVVINGDLFGVNQAYTHSIARIQPDPLFFVNISDGLLTYDATRSRWVNRRPQVFERLGLLRTQLENEGIVSPQ